MLNFTEGEQMLSYHMPREGNMTICKQNRDHHVRERERIFKIKKKPKKNYRHIPRLFLVKHSNNN